MLVKGATGGKQGEILTEKWLTKQTFVWVKLLYVDVGLSWTAYWCNNYGGVEGPPHIFFDIMVSHTGDLATRP